MSFWRMCARAGDWFWCLAPAQWSHHGVVRVSQECNARGLGVLSHGCPHMRIAGRREEFRWAAASTNLELFDVESSVGPRTVRGRLPSGRALRSRFPCIAHWEGVSLASTVIGPSLIRPTPRPSAAQHGVSDRCSYTRRSLGRRRSVFVAARR